MFHKKILALGDRYRFLIINFIVGAVELTLELTATRIAAPYIGLTIYVWTSVIGIILASLALGYLWGGRLADTRKRPMDVVYLLLLAATSIGVINAVKDPLLAVLSQQHMSLQVKALLASGLLFVVPTVLLGSISPYLVRLSINNVSTSGTRASQINAAGTFGSLFGTFFTGFYLFAHVGTRNILSVLGFLLIITSFFIATTTLNQLRLLLCATAVASLLSPSQLFITGVSKDLDTPYNRYMIRDLGAVRFLQSDSLARQSGIIRSKPDQPYFPYVRVFSDVSALSPRSDNYLVIGGGAFTLPAIFTQTHPRTNVDVVEIDPALLPISKQYFGLPPNARFRTFNEDGRQYLNDNHKLYDIIYMDAFSNSTPPFQLLTKQAVERLYASVTPSGFVATNMLASLQGPGGRYVSSVERTYRQVFPHVYMFRINKARDPANPQNILLLASNKPLDNALNALAGTKPEFKVVQQGKLSLAPDSGIVFSDDFAPAEQMLAQQE